MEKEVRADIFSQAELLVGIVAVTLAGIHQYVKYVILQLGNGTGFLLKVLTKLNASNPSTAEIEELDKEICSLSERSRILNQAMKKG